jgi:prolyl-tRNA synthetase
VELYRRDTGEKIFVHIDELPTTVISLLEEMQKVMYQRHETFTKENTFVVDTYDEFKEKVETGFVLAHWDGTRETAERIQEETKATIRCLPFEYPIEEGTDMLTGQKSERRVIFAKSY